MKLLTHGERAQRLAAHQSARTIHSTPALQAFLHRPDVRHLTFPSGSQHVYVGDESFVADTLLGAVERAMKVHPSPL